MSSRWPAATCTPGCALTTRSTASRANVADDDRRPGLDQMADQAPADLAHALDADHPAVQAGLTPGVLGCRPHALEHAERGEHGGVARAAVRHRAPGDVPRLPADDVHVLAVGADVTRGDVAPVQRLDEPAVRAEQRLGLAGGRIADDDGLPAAVIQPGQRVLVGHGAGQVEHVGQGAIFVRIRVEPRPAQARAERGGVDGDDGPQAAVRVLAEDDLLVPVLVIRAGSRAARVRAGEHAGHCGGYLSWSGVGRRPGCRPDGLAQGWGPAPAQRLSPR